MARTRRSRQAADAPAATVPASSDTEQQTAQTRGRTRTSRPVPASKRQASVESTTVAGPSRPPQPPSRAAASSIRNASVDSVEIGRRAALETPSILRHRDNTGLDLADDSIFGDLGDSFADGDVPFDADIAVPGSGSTTRSWSHLKPRSRQSSFVGRNDPPIRPSSRSGAGGANSSTLASSLNIGAFRRRAREPSILGTTRRAARQGPRSETSGRGAQSDLESDAGDFAPDAESTPLHPRRRTTRASLAANVSTATTTTTTTTRKRKSDAVTAAAEEEERAAKASRVEGNSDSDSEISELDSPQMPPSTPIRQREMTPVNLDEINAPPASSGSEDEGDMWPDIRTLAKRRRRASFTTPLRGAAAGSDDEILSDVSSPPSLTHSPNITAKGARGRAAAAHRAHEPKPLMTADLANLLPKRRYKKARHGGVDGENNEEDEEEEEEEVPEEEDVEEVPLTRTRGGRISRPPSRAGSTTAGNSNKQPSTPAARARRAANVANRTYGRQSSDKENNSSHQSDDDDDEEGGDSQFRPLADDTFGESTSVAMDFQSVDELRQATKKFVEVDKWALEYEEVAESFSPKGAR